MIELKSALYSLKGFSRTFLLCFLCLVEENPMIYCVTSFPAQKYVRSPALGLSSGLIGIGGRVRACVRASARAHTRVLHARGIRVLSPCTLQRANETRKSEEKLKNPPLFMGTGLVTPTLCVLKYLGKIKPMRNRLRKFLRGCFFPLPPPHPPGGLKNGNEIWEKGGLRWGGGGKK